MKEKLIQILTEVCPGVDFEGETALIDDGILESLDIVAIVTELRETFGADIGVDDLLPENFDSADAMLALVERRQG